ncbi:MAG: ABC transporter permease [Bacteroidota bacterium]
MIAYLNVLRSEYKKTKNIWGFSISLAGPIVVTLIVAFGTAFNAHKIEGEDAARWFTHGRYIFQFFFFLYPLYVALMAFLLTNIEHKNRGFKQLFTYPAPKSYFYGSKVVVLLSWILSSLITAFIMLVLTGKVLAVLFPHTGYTLEVPYQLFGMFMLRLGLILLSIIAIHFVLSIYWDNFIVSVGSASFLVVTGMVITNWEYSFLVPYCYPLKTYISYMGQNVVIFDRELWIGLAYAVGFFTIGYILMARKQIKS